MNNNGLVLKQYKGEKLDTIFEGACVSAHGNILYGFANDGYIYCYDIKTTKAIHHFNANTSDIIGIIHHPTRNIIVVYDMSGNLTIFRP